VAALRAYLDGLLDFVWENLPLIRALGQSEPNQPLLPDRRDLRS